MHPVSEHRPRQDEERELLAAVVDHVGPLMVLEPDGKIVRFNRAAERLTGREAADAVGRNLFESGLIPAEQLASLAAEPEQPAEDDTLWGRSRDFDWGD